MSSYFLYILKSKSFDKFYTGISQNPYEDLNITTLLKKDLPQDIVLGKLFLPKNLIQNMKHCLPKEKSKIGKVKK